MTVSQLMKSWPRLLSKDHQARDVSDNGMNKESGMSWRTHDVFNQFSELSDYNLFTTDRALTEALDRNADWSSEQLTAYGASLGSAQTYALADNANRHKPELQIFDSRGRRIDFVDFHPSWHSLLWCRYRSASRGRDDGRLGQPDSICTRRSSTARSVRRR